MADKEKNFKEWYKNQLERVAKNRKDMKIKNDLLSLMVDEQAAEMNAEERKKFREEYEQFKKQKEADEFKRFKKYHKKWNKNTGKFDQVVKSGGKVYASHDKRYSHGGKVSGRKATYKY